MAIRTIAVIIFLFFAAVAMAFVGKKTFHTQSRQPPMKTQLPPTPTPTPLVLKVTGWIPYWDQNRALQSFYQHPSAFNYISLFWYKIDPNGNLTTYTQVNEDQSIITTIHSNNAKALALVANLADFNEKGGWNAQRVEKAISTETARKKHIRDIIAIVENKNFDGVDIDYEALHASQKDTFTIFIRELADALHQRGKILGVAIHPKTSENNPAEDNGSHAQDLAQLAKSADQLYFMTYLEHDLTSDPGPDGSVQWIEQVMKYAIGSVGVPKEKAFLGIGLMGTSWRIDPDGSTHGERNDIPFQDILAFTQNNNTTPQWDDTAKESHYMYSDQYGGHIVWFENNDSMKARLNLAKRLGVGGVGLWRLGGEDPAIWNNSL